MALMEIGRSPPWAAANTYCALKPGNVPLLSSAATWLNMSRRRPSSVGEDALFCAPAQGALVGFANDNCAYRVALNFFNPSTDTGNVTPTHAAPLSTM